MFVEDTDEHIVAFEAGIVFAFAFDGNAEKTGGFELDAVAQVDRKAERIETRSEVGTGGRHTDSQSCSLTDRADPVIRECIVGKIV